jgi:hypothetical protein
VQVGTSSADLPLAARLDLRGPVVEVIDRHEFLTPSVLE